jgi:hypothetical protein
MEGKGVWRGLVEVLMGDCAIGCGSEEDERDTEY